MSLPDEDKYWERGPGKGAENVTFLEYLIAVKSDPARADELKGLIVLFGEKALERVLRGEIVITARNFIK